MKHYTFDAFEQNHHKIAFRALSKISKHLFAYFCIYEVLRYFYRKTTEIATAVPIISRTPSQAASAFALAKVKLMGSQESNDALAMLRETGASWGETVGLETFDKKSGFYFKQKNQKRFQFIVIQKSEVLEPFSASFESFLFRSFEAHFFWEPF